MKGYRRLAISLLLAGCAATLSVAAKAEVYRWVDDKGRVHFGDKAPATTQAETLDLPKVEEQPGAPDLSEFERMQRQKRLVQMLEEERLAKQEKKAKLAQEAQELEQYCTRFKNRLSYLDQYTHFFNEKDDGTRDYLSEEEADAYRTKLKSQYQRECGEI